VMLGTPTTPECILQLPLAGADAATPARVLACSAEDVPPAALVSVPRAISFPSAGGRTAHAFHYVLHEPSDSDCDLLCLSGRGDKDLAEVLAS